MDNIAQTIKGHSLAFPTQCSDLASLINQRLSYKKDVAGYKAEKHLAIEDVPQEVNVMTNSVAVADLGCSASR